MLVLSRKVDEQIIIGDNVRVTVVSIRGNQVRLGFEAPPSVPIFREELHSITTDDRLGSGQACRGVATADRSVLLIAGDDQ